MAGVPITPAEFKVRFPEFASELDARIQAIIDEAVEFLDCYTSSTAYRTLQLFYVAHVLAIEKEQAAGDSAASLAATSKSVGSVSVGFAGPMGSTSNQKSYFNSTSYGQYFWMHYYKAAIRVRPLFISA